MSRNDDRPNTKGRSGRDESLDFGAFVSSNVQRTSDRLRGGQAPADAPPRQQVVQPVRPGGERPVERARDQSYWRRQAAGTGPSSDDDEGLPPPQKPAARSRYLPSRSDQADQFHEDNEFGNAGGFGGFFGNFFSDDGDNGNRNRIIAAILAVLLLLAIIFGLTRLFGGDDGGNDVVPTPTVTQTVEAPAGSDEGPTDLTGVTPTPPATGEPEIPRGGDNQRGESGFELEPFIFAQARTG